MRFLMRGKMVIQANFIAHERRRETMMTAGVAKTSDNGFKPVSRVAVASNS